MKPTTKVNKIAQILAVYAILNIAGGLVVSFLLFVTGTLDGFPALALFVAVLIASFLVLGLSEIIQLLYMIYLNTEKETEATADELPEV